jgi:hypothetical protein
VTESGGDIEPRSPHRAGRMPDPTALARHEHVHRSNGGSRAALVVGLETFRSIGGFDENALHVPLEDVCWRLRGHGVEIGFDPRLAVMDLSFRRSSQRSQRARSAEWHRLRRADPSHRPAGLADTPPAVRSLRILVIEDRVPHPELGQGYPRSHLLLKTLTDAGHRVTLFPRQDPAESPPSIYRDLPRTVAVLRGLGSGGVHDVLASHGAEFDLIVVARPDNMRVYREAVDALPRPIADALPPVIYDAEALGALRDIRRAEVLGRPLSPAEASEAVRREVALAHGCRLVIAVIFPFSLFQHIPVNTRKMRLHFTLKAFHVEPI